EPVEHRAGLLPRPAMRLPDLHPGPARGLPLPRERRVEVHVQLPRRVVGHVEQLDLTARLRATPAPGRREDRRGQDRPPMCSSPPHSVLLALRPPPARPEANRFEVPKHEGPRTAPGGGPRRTSGPLKRPASPRPPD